MQRCITEVQDLPSALNAGQIQAAQAICNPVQGVLRIMLDEIRNHHQEVLMKCDDTSKNLHKDNVQKNSLHCVEAHVSTEILRVDDAQVNGKECYHSSERH